MTPQFLIARRIRSLSPNLQGAMVDYHNLVEVLRKEITEQGRFPGGLGAA